jgi:hypothetical protein
MVSDWCGVTVVAMGVGGSRIAKEYAEAHSRSLIRMEPGQHPTGVTVFESGGNPLTCSAPMSVCVVWKFGTTSNVEWSGSRCRSVVCRSACTQQSAIRLRSDLAISDLGSVRQLLAPVTSWSVLGPHSLCEACQGLHRPCTPQPITPPADVRCHTPDIGRRPSALHLRSALADLASTRRCLGRTHRHCHERGRYMYCACPADPPESQLRPTRGDTGTTWGQLSLGRFLLLSDGREQLRNVSADGGDGVSGIGEYAL